ncbi:DUF3048 domain-containing protein [Myceligenerans crystallogenes]|uniref:DUF3048 domain-containing protein n=1 Tax=Myceligenerans crystallogenes TaxID=316335 RepID=UPI0031D728F2
MTLRTRRGAGLVALVTALAIGLTGCTGDLAWPWDEPEPLPTPTETLAADTKERKDSPPEPKAPPRERHYWPLTGHEGKPRQMNRPAVSVKIENAPEARPTRGLEAADIVWEEVVEGGITRFVAVYHSRLPDAVEPVRSVRPMDAAIVAPMKGMLAYSGGQLPFIDRVNRVSTQSLVMDDGHDGFYRDPARAAPHNVIGKPREFLAQERGDMRLFSPPPAQFIYAPHAGKGSAAQKGTRARSLSVRLSNFQTSNWYWDVRSRTYQRSEGSSPSMAMSGARHGARNVVVLGVDMVNTAYTDPSGAPVPETRLVNSSGEGFVAAHGKVKKIRWKKGRIHAPIVLKLANGKQAQLEPGNTWVELVPRSSGSWSVR